MQESIEMTTGAHLYLDLLKKCLTRYLFIDEEVRDVLTPDDPWNHNHAWSEGPDWKRRVWSPVQRVLADRGVRVVTQSGNPEYRMVGHDWPLTAETMIGLRRLDHVQECIEQVLRDDVPGDLIETGVWRGGTTILMRATLAAYGDETRSVWVADSFEGLPKPNGKVYAADDGWDLSVHPELAVGVDIVKANFERYGLLDDRVKFLVGWFKDTLPDAPIASLAVMRLDGDYYESTMDALTALHPRLSPGGFVIIDDYGLDPCREAVHDYRKANEIDEEITVLDPDGAFWRKRL
jgi:O-methyltransferase